MTSLADLVGGASPATRLVPCVVTSLSPLLVTVLGGSNVRAVPVPGLTYSLAPAVCFVAPGVAPVVLPIG